MSIQEDYTQAIFPLPPRPPPPRPPRTPPRKAQEKKTTPSPGRPARSPSFSLFPRTPARPERYTSFQNCPRPTTAGDEEEREHHTQDDNNPFGSGAIRLHQRPFETPGESPFETPAETSHKAHTPSLPPTPPRSQTSNPPAEASSPSSSSNHKVNKGKFKERLPPEEAPPGEASPKEASPEGALSEKAQPDGETTHPQYDYGWPVLPPPENPGRSLTAWLMHFQRSLFIAFVVLINVGLAMGALYSNVDHMTLAFVAFFKAKDVTCVLISAAGLAGLFVQRQVIARLLRKEAPAPVPRRWILSLIPTYNESEEQILKCISSLRDNGLGPHRQVMVVVMDGRPKELRSALRDDRVVLECERPYDTLKYTRGSLRVTAGWVEDGNVPVILLEKAKNCGKKDSLVLCHDLFNAPRDNMPTYTRLLRQTLWQEVLPQLTQEVDAVDAPTRAAGTQFDGFHGIFCTDADSKLHEGALRYLIEALYRDPQAIAACGSVFVELEKGYEWSFWNLYQQFQYTFGQFVRRRAEGFLGKTTCLPGCVTMIAVRPEMAGAIAKYARPVTTPFILRHQVQNLGTDRRLTYAMLSQSHALHTLFVPEAGSETVAPQSLKHYLSQRRRWGSNAHFNSYFYMGGTHMHLVIRIWAAIDVARQIFVYYRILNTAFFIRGLITAFDFMDILPLLVVGQLPLAWYCVCMVMEPQLRRRMHKLVPGFIINKVVSPFMSIMVFTEVAFNLGSNVWGLSGITASSAPASAGKGADDLGRAEEGQSEKVVAGGQQSSPVLRPVSRCPSVL